MSTRRRPATSYERATASSAPTEDDEAIDTQYSRKLRRTETGDAGTNPSPVRTPNKAGRGASPRITFSKTRTLKGAFESTAGPGDGVPADAQTNRSPSKYATRTSPGPKRSDPPAERELLGTYRWRGSGGGDNGGAEYIDGLEDADQLSPSPVTRKRYGMDSSGRYGNDSFDFMDFIEEPVSRRRSQHARDQQRLKRVTERETPVLSKAHVGTRARAFTAHIPRQSEEEKERENVGESERFGEPGLNIPKSWGTRARLSRPSLGRVNRNNETNDLVNEVEHPPEPESDNDVDFTARSLQISNSPPVRTRIGPHEQVSATLPAMTETVSPSGVYQKNGVTNGHGAEEVASGGSPIPNTPVVVYENSNQDRPRTISRDDSRDLLRKLARKESPSYNSDTPEQKNIDDTISNMKTPVVMGAWVDTPVPERTTSAPEPNLGNSAASASTSTQPAQKEPPHRTEEEQTSSPIATSPKKAKVDPRSVRRARIELEKPRLPKSALADVVEEAKAGQDQSLVIGENTIDSLQGILNDDATTSELKNAGGLTNQYTASEKGEKASTETSASDGAVLPKTDEAVIDRLNGKLLSLVRNIKEVRDGLTGLETQATEDATIFSSRSKKLSEQPHSCRKGKTCTTCGLADDGRRYVALPLPELWRRSPGSYRVRPTILGWVILTALLWYISEATMCELYCHPMYLPTGMDLFVDPKAPRMPWVIPTILWRWSHLSYILAPIWAVAVALFRFVAQMLGLWDGFVDAPMSHAGGRPLTDDVSASFARARSGYVPRYDPPIEREPPVARMWQQDHAEPDFSMQEDEIL